MKTKLILLLAALGLASASVQAQTTVIDFQTDGANYTPSATEGSTTSSTDVFNRVNDPIGGKVAGDFYWAVEDISLDAPSITLDTIDITGQDLFTFSIDFLTLTSAQWDTTDELLITYTVDSGTAQNLMWVQSNEDGSNTNTPAALDLNFDGTGDAGQELPAITNAFSVPGLGSDFETFSTNSIGVSGANLDITFQFERLTSTGESIYFDNINVTVIPEPSSIALMAMVGLAAVVVLRGRKK